MCVCALSHFSHVQPFATSWTIVRQTPLPMEFSRQEYWSQLPCPPPGDLPDPGIEPTSLKSRALAGMFFITRTTWEAHRIISSVQFSCSVVSNSLRPHGLQQASLPCPSPAPGVYSNSCPSVMPSVMPSNHLILCHPLLLLPSIFPSIRVFSDESVLRTRWPKYWSFSFNISPSNEHPGLIPFRMVWLDLLAVQGTLKNLLQQLQFKTINSLGLSFLYSPTLTSIPDYWKNHSFD